MPCVVPNVRVEAGPAAKPQARTMENSASPLCGPAVSMLGLASNEGLGGCGTKREGVGMRFPNKAGQHADTDDTLRAELHAAGIQTFQEAEGKPHGYLADLLRSGSGEVKTSVRGILHGWVFERAWYYWAAKGPGIEVEAAERLHATNGKAVRVDGHCGCPSPREWFKGLACGFYHVDDAEGLRALADCIKGLVARSKTPNVRAEAGPTAKRQARAVENAPAHCAGLAF